MPAYKHVRKRQTSARNWLEEQSKKELIQFILEVALEHPRISELLSDREQEAHDWIVEGFAKTINKLPGMEHLPPGLKTTAHGQAAIN
jgi:hypothetical protein